MRRISSEPHRLKLLEIRKKFSILPSYYGGSKRLLEELSLKELNSLSLHVKGIPDKYLESLVRSSESQLKGKPTYEYGRNEEFLWTKLAEANFVLKVKKNIKGLIIDRSKSILKARHELNVLEREVAEVSSPDELKKLIGVVRAKLYDLRNKDPHLSKDLSNEINQLESAVLQSSSTSNMIMNKVKRLFSKHRKQANIPQNKSKEANMSHTKISNLEQRIAYLEKEAVFGIFGPSKEESMRQIAKAISNRLVAATRMETGSVKYTKKGKFLIVSVALKVGRGSKLRIIYSGHDKSLDVSVHGLNGSKQLARVEAFEFEDNFSLKDLNNQVKFVLNSRELRNDMLKRIR